MTEKIFPTDEINKELIQLIEDYVGNLDYINIKDVGLYYDLGIYGEDAYELLNKYSEKFNVSMVDFRFDMFFPSEGLNVFGGLWRFFPRQKPKKYKQITIEDLQKGIKVGKLSTTK